MICGQLSIAAASFVWELTYSSGRLSCTTPPRASLKFQGGLGILNGSSNIQEREAELQKNKRVRSVVQSPDTPKHVAQKKQPESPVPLKLPLRSDHPGGNNCHQHRGPLKTVEYCHSIRFHDDLDAFVFVILESAVSRRRFIE